jgi:hypothetical protein
MTDVELQMLFDFDEEDLAANRAGRLSLRQEKRIKEAQSVHTRFFVGTGILSILAAGGIAVGVTSSAIRHGVSLSTASQNYMTGMIATIGIPWFVLGLLAWISFKVAANKVDPTVQCVRGRANFIKAEKVFSEKQPNGSRSYRTVMENQLRVGKVIFENLDSRVFNILEEQDIYTFYYTKDSMDILSAEHIAKGK